MYHSPLLVWSSKINRPNDDEQKGEGHRKRIREKRERNHRVGGRAYSPPSS